MFDETSSKWSIAAKQDTRGAPINLDIFQDRSRHILIHGLMLVMVGLLWGFVVPHTPHPRLALGAHIQFVSNGLLIIIMAAMLLKLPHNVRPKSAGVMLLAAWLIWPMALSEAANAWWGTTQMLPIAAGQAGATGGAAWHELVVKLTHIAAGLGLVAAWGLLVAGFLKKPAVAGTANG
jgi:hydroxylaminobenzene mutase